MTLALGMIHVGASPGGAYFMQTVLSQEISPFFLLS
jgi:hypothetical protein